MKDDSHRRIGISECLKGSYTFSPGVEAKSGLEYRCQNRLRIPGSSDSVLIVCLRSKVLVGQLYR